MVIAGCMALVKAALTAVAIYHITPLDLPSKVIQRIDSLRSAYLWAGTDKVTSSKCKINWEQVCKPIEYGGLGIHNLRKVCHDATLEMVMA